MFCLRSVRIVPKPLKRNLVINQLSIKGPDLLELEKRRPSHQDNDSKWEFLYGIHPVSSAIAANRRTVEMIYYRRDLVEHNEKVKNILKSCWEANIPTTPITNRKIDTMLPQGKLHQGLLAKVSKLKTIDMICSKEFVSSLTLSETTPTVWLMLNEIQDPMNFGSIVRSAYFLGCDKIFVTSQNSCSLTPVVSKASSGAIEFVPVYSVKDVSSFIQILKDMKWDIVGTTSYMDNLKNGVECKPLGTFKHEQSSLVLLGNEGRGLPEHILSLCTRALYIESQRKMTNCVDSLNVSAASAIILHHLLNKF